MLNAPKVIIIGAGAAGIAAAVRLIERGFENIIILEGKNRIGGRIHTAEFADNFVELGAQWVHGEQGNVIFNLASSHNLLSSSKCFNKFDQHIFVTAKGEILSNVESSETLKRYYDISDSILDDVHNAESYGEYFVNRFYKAFEKDPFTSRERVEHLLDWLQKFDNSIQCSDSWFQVSAKKITDYWTCEGDHVLNWKDKGYKTLFELLSRKISSSEQELPILEKIEFNKNVDVIDYTSNNEVIVKTKDGSEYTGTHVIVTVSLGVLKEKHDSLFAPSLPEGKQLAIKGLHIGTVNKVFLEFPHRWWQDECAGFSLIWSNEDREEFIKTHGNECEWLCDVFGFIAVDYQPRVLCAWISGKHAKEIEKLSDNDVSDGLYLLLDMFLSNAYNIPKFDQMLRSNWYTDEFFRGSYSFKSITTEELNVETEDLAEPIVTPDGKPVILFAGEATHEHYYSTVHGAVETGFREADRIVDFHRTCGWPKPTAPIQIRTKIAIIGAGIAGLAAAKTLEDANFKDYILLEAQNRIGGRIHSISWNEGWIEEGAQFVHGDQSQLAQLCYEHDLLSDIPCRDGQGTFIRDGHEIESALVEEIDDLVRTTLENCENYVDRDVEPGNGNIEAVLKDSLNKHLNENDDSMTLKSLKADIFDWNIRFLAIDNACYSLKELSTKYWGKFKFTGGPEHLLFKLHYQTLPNLIADSLSMKSLHLNTAMNTVEWQQSGNCNSKASVTLNASNGTQILADCVIITCSLGYLKENHEKMFRPPLPSPYRDAIHCLGFGLINKVFLDFGIAWWKPRIKGFQLLKER